MVLATSCCPIAGLPQLDAMSFFIFPLLPQPLRRMYGHWAMVGTILQRLEISAALGLFNLGPSNCAVDVSSVSQLLNKDVFPSDRPPQLAKMSVSFLSQEDRFGQGFLTKHPTRLKGIRATHCYRFRPSWGAKSIG